MLDKVSHLASETERVVLRSTQYVTGISEADTRLHESHRERIKVVGETEEDTSRRLGGVGESGEVRLSIRNRVGHRLAERLGEGRAHPHDVLDDLLAVADDCFAELNHRLLSETDHTRQSLECALSVNLEGLHRACGFVERIVEVAAEAGDRSSGLSDLITSYAERVL